EELWRVLGHEGYLMDQKWPEADAEALTRESMTIIVQVNGKLRGRLEVPVDIEKGALEEMARTDVNVVNHLQGKQIRKTIVVPGRLVNFVVG
ncbi:MAG: class I tRNA ligase family protein, partial [Magnetococcales bacterium]|nr:class I tRNA ligase family protein [Magnetococcales bacterium]